MTSRHRRRRAPAEQGERRSRLTPAVAVLGGGGSLATVFLASWFSLLVGGLLFIAFVLVGGLLWAVFSKREEPFARVKELTRLVKGGVEAVPPATTVIEARVVADVLAARPSLEGVSDASKPKDEQPKRQIQRRRGNA